MLRVIASASRFGTLSVLSILFAMMMLFVSKNAFALDAQDCITQVENITYENARYFRITRVDRKECDLYMIANNFPQLDPDGKPLPIQKQLRSIKTANDRLMQGKRGLRAVHSGCVPDSKPWPDQTLAEREMCSEQKVNYYPVAHQILVPRIPELSESEQIQHLNFETCEALSKNPNPSESVKGILLRCKKHYSSITIPKPSVSTEQRQLSDTRAKVAVLIKTTSEQARQLQIAAVHAEDLAKAKKIWNWIAIFFICISVIMTAGVITSRRQQSKLQDEANITRFELNERVQNELIKRDAGPTPEAHRAVQQENIALQDSLQRVTHEKAILSQEFADMRHENESVSARLTAEIDSLNTQVALLSAERDEQTLQVQDITARFETSRYRLGKVEAENIELKKEKDALGLQLEQLYEVEQRVRGEHLMNLDNSIDLARQVIAQLDERYRVSVAKNETQKAEAQAERMNALQQILATTVDERDSRSLALGNLAENDPRKTNPESFLRALMSDVNIRNNDLAYVVKTNLTLGKLSNQLASENSEALEELARLRRENAELLIMWDHLVTGIARGLKLDIDSIGQLSREGQAAQLALAIGELKAQRFSENDSREQIVELMDRLDNTMTHNAALRKAMEGDTNRQTIAALEFTAIKAEVEMGRMGTALNKAREELKAEHEAKTRLQAAVRAQSGAGLLALEAPELAVLPTHRLMNLLQTCVLAVHQKPDAAADAEYVLGSDADVGALYSFLHMPIVSENGYRLPANLRTNLGPLQIYHVADEVCDTRVQPPARIPSVTPTISPPALSSSDSDIRKQTMQGLGRVTDLSRTLPYPPKATEMDLVRDPDEEDKPTH